MHIQFVHFRRYKQFKQSDPSLEIELSIIFLKKKYVVTVVQEMAAFRLNFSGFDKQNVDYTTPELTALAPRVCLLQVQIVLSLFSDLLFPVICTTICGAH